MSNIQDIEAVDDFFTFHSILEENSNDQIQLELETRIRSHDKDIERICNLYYQGFINSIRELLHVRPQVKRLNEEVSSFYATLNKESSRVLMKEKDLLRARQVESNIANAIDGLNSCLPVLECYSKLLRQLKDKRYLPAMKTLEHLENEQLPKVDNFRFTAQIKKAVPKLKDNIKKWADADFKEFLENIRKCSPKIGEVEIRHTKQVEKRDLRTIVVKHTMNATKDYAVDDLSAQDLIDFSPIYRCLQIHTVLNDKEYFEKDYRKQRREQAKLVLQAPQDMYDNLDDYKIYIYSIVGFFIVEDHVMNTAGDMVIRSYLDDLWSTSLHRIVNVLSMSSSSCTDPNVLLGIKDLIVLSMATLKNYGYTVTQLWDMLLEMRDHYNEVLLERWVNEFRNVLEKGDFLPLQVNNQEEYDAILQRLPFHSEELENQQYPMKLPFSKMVPEVHHQIKEFMYACMKFSEELTRSPREAAAMLRKAVNLLLTRTFSGCLSDVFCKPGLTLMQIIQIIIDTQYLERAEPFLDDFVCKLTGTQQAIKQAPSPIFQAVRSDAEMQVSAKLCSKLDDFFEEIKKYDWLLAEPIGQPSPFITDMLEFLQSTFHYFSYLQPEVAQAACKKAYEHIAASFHKSLISGDVKQISTGALQQLSLDLMQCEMFAGTDPVPGLGVGEAIGYFTELRQLLDLLILEEWSAYLHDYGKTENRYNLVQSSTVIVLLEKLREVQDKKTMFSVLKKFERDKKKLWETVLKQVKQLGNRQK